MRTDSAKQFDSIWETSRTPPDVFSFVQQLDNAATDDVLGVILTDQTHRWKTENPYQVEAYLKRLPGLADDSDCRLQLAIGEFRARHAAGADSDIVEFLSRFGDIKEQLRKELSNTCTVEETVVGVPLDEFRRLCEQFEAEWSDGCQPSVDEYLEECPAESRGRMLSELLPVELRWRQKQDENPRPEDYCARYPDYIDEVKIAFGELADVDAIAPTLVPSQSSEGLIRRKLDDRQYKILNEVARGGMGVVHRVWDDSLGRQIAMKVIRGDDEMGSSPVDSVDRSVYQRFVREAEITGQLDHPGVVPIHELGVDEKNRTYFTMRLIEGDNLHHIYQLVKDGKTSWSETRAVGIIVNVCDTIAFAHSRNIIHRDLKPANVMVGQFGETYVMDWGLAKALHSDSQTSTAASPLELQNEPVRDSSGPLDDETMDGAVLGTPAYMPPEQAGGLITNIDERSDIYSIGAMLYELLAGIRPYKDIDPPPRGFQLVEAVVKGPPTSLSKLSPKCPPELVSVCQKAMARSAEARYQTAQEMSDDLRAYLEGRVVRAHRTGPWVELKKWIGRNRGLATAMVSTVLIAVCGLAAIVSLQRSKNSELKAANEKTTQERNYAQSLYLAQRATDSVDTDPALALLLAQESLKRDTNSTTRTAFYTAIGSLDEKRTLIGHSAEVWRAEFSPDGSRVATASDDHTVAMWDIKTGEQREIWTDHEDAVRRIAWSPDGRLLATAGFDSKVVVRDAETGRPVWEHVHAGGVWSLDFSPDSELFVSTSGEKCILSESDSGREIKVFDAGSLIEVARFSPDGSLLVLGTKAGMIQISELGSTRSQSLRHSDGAVKLLQFSYSGDRLMTSDRDTGGRDVVIWNPHTADQIVVLEHQTAVTAACLSQDGQTVVTGQRNGRMTIWSVSDSRKEHVHEFGTPIRFVDIANDSQQFLACVGNKIYRGRISQPASLTSLKGHAQDVLRGNFHDDASLIVSCSRDQTARVWATSQRRLVPRIETGQSGFPFAETTVTGDAVCFVRVRNQDVDAGDGSSAQLWSADNDGLIRVLNHSSNVLGAVPLRSGTLVTWCRGSVSFWREDGTLIKSPLRTNENTWVVSSRDNEFALLLDRNVRSITKLTANGDVVENFSMPLSARETEDPLVWLETKEETLRLHHLQKGTRVEVLVPVGHKLICSANGRLITGSTDESHPTVMWSMEDGKQLVIFDQSASPPLVNASLVADGTRLLASSLRSPGVIRVWNAQTGERLPDLSGHVASYVRTVALPGGQELITLDDRAVRLWDLATCTLTHVISEHFVPPSTLAWSPDGGYLALPGTVPNTVNIWKLKELELCCVLPVRGTPQLLKFRNSTDLITANDSGLFEFWSLQMYAREIKGPRKFRTLEAVNLEPTARSE